MNSNIPGPGYCRLNPIVTRQRQVVNRYYVVEQPHIIENETVYVNHYVTRHTYENRPCVTQQNIYTEENNGCCNLR